jgi:AcrR family transcriptional regulator
LPLLDAEGLDALTMRRVAEELGTGPASLYAHVAHKEDLVAALLDRIIGELELPGEPDSKRWQEQVKEFARRSRAIYGRHADIVRASIGSIPSGDNALHMIEWLLSVLLAGGVSPQVAAWGVDILGLYITATAYEESLEELQHAGGEVHWSRHDRDPTTLAAFQEEVRDWFETLPADRYPTLVSMAGPLTTGDDDERFEFGLEVLVRGIASTVSEPRRKRRSR